MRRAAAVLAAISIAALAALQTLLAPAASTAGPVPQLTQTLPPPTLVKAGYLPLIVHDWPPPRPTRTPRPTATRTPTPTNTPTPTGTATATATNTPTPQITHTVDLSGTVFLRPQYRIIVDGTCQPIVEDWTNRIDPDHAADGISPELMVVYPTVGYMYLYDQTGNHLPDGRGKIRIYQDSQVNHLRYLAQGLLPGRYIARAYVGYKGNDAVSRVYTRLFDSTQGQAYETMTLTIAPASMPGQVVIQDLFLMIDGSACPRP
jgi:hypothetical protein